MRHVGPRAQRLLVEVVERGQAAREEFAIDDALGETVGAAETHALAEFGNALADQTLVARAERGETIAHHDPVGQLAVDEAALAARFTHHVGIVALAGDGEIGRIERGEHVEIDEAVVERRHQRIGHRVREAHQIAVMAGRIDHHHVVGVFDRTDRLGKVIELFRLVRFHRIAFGAADDEMRRQFELDAGALGPGAAIFDVMREALLARVEVDGGDALPGLEQGDGNMQSRRGFSRAAFLVTEHDDMRRLRGLLDRLD